MKTGGTSVISWVRSGLARSSLYRPSTYGLRDVGPGGSLSASLFSKMLPEVLHELDRHEHLQLRWYDPHLPVAAAELVPGPLDRVVTLRNPVHRTISHLTQLLHLELGRPPIGTELEQRYDDIETFARFVWNYQTKMLAMRRSEMEHPVCSREVYEARRRVVVEELREALSEGITDHDVYRERLLPRLAGEVGDNAMVARLEDATMMEMFHALFEPPLARKFVIDDARHERATRVLEDVEVVGVTERLDALVGDLARRFTLPDLPTPRMNRSPSVQVSQAFRQRVERDNPYDMELHARARELVAERKPRPTVVRSPSSRPSRRNSRVWAR